MHVFSQKGKKVMHSYVNSVEVNKIRIHRYKKIPGNKYELIMY